MHQTEWSENTSKITVGRSDQLVFFFVMCQWKKYHGGTPGKKEKLLRGGLKSQYQTSPTNFSSGIPLIELELNSCNASGYNEAFRDAP